MSCSYKRLHFCPFVRAGRGLQAAVLPRFHGHHLQETLCWCFRGSPSFQGLRLVCPAVSPALQSRQPPGGGGMRSTAFTQCCIPARGISWHFPPTQGAPTEGMPWALILCTQQDPWTAFLLPQTEDWVTERDCQSGPHTKVDTAVRLGRAGSISSCQRSSESPGHC